MRALLDVNVLIALLDADHSLHARATDWFASHARAGWASCPITQNGCVRIMSHPGYPNTLPVRESWNALPRRALAASTSSGRMTSACSTRNGSMLRAFTDRAS